MGLGEFSTLERIRIKNDNTGNFCDFPDKMRLIAGKVGNFILMFVI